MQNKFDSICLETFLCARISVKSGLRDFSEEIIGMAEDIHIDAVASKDSGMESSLLRWDLCVLCQSAPKESLTCQAKSKRHDLGAGYKSLAEKINSFTEIRNFPTKLHDGLLNIT